MPWHRWTVWFVLTVLSAAPSHAAEWKPAFQEDFGKPGWESSWSFKGSVGPLDQSALVSGGREMTAALSRTFQAPAIRVEYSAKFTAAGGDGEVSDLSMFVGDVLFQVWHLVWLVDQLAHCCPAPGLLGAFP